MDETRFDSLVVKLTATRNRRAALRALGIGALATLLRVPQPAAAQCKKTGGRCRRNHQCCSGKCRKRGKKKGKRCARLPRQAFGCTIALSSCADADSATPCPRNEFGRCRLGIDGQPVCTTRGTLECESCQRDSDCIAAEGPGAICVRCDSCPGGTSCICPMPPPDEIDD
jgi:hypothetical protein